MCDIEGINEYENEVLNVFKCRECGEISNKEIMCHCNDDKAKEYIDNHPHSQLSLNLVKCYKCSNSWHGYKRCDCDKLNEDEDKNEDDNDDDNDEHYFNDFVKCDNCGNIWDGCAQCNCWGLVIYIVIMKIVMKMVMKIIQYLNKV